MTKKIKCDSCNLVMISGVLCHETGCPDSWRFKEIECPWCGSKFVPEERDQEFCDDSCYLSYWGLDCEEEE